MSKKKVVSITANDCQWDFFRGSGPGGQNRNKNSTAVRCTHKASGAVGQASEHKSQVQNRRAAFRRMARDVKFRMWVNEQVRLAAGKESIEKKVEKAMRPDNLKVEVRDNGVWSLDRV